MGYIVWVSGFLRKLDQLIVMCKQEKDELLEQAMLDAILNRESWHKKFKEQGWML